MKRCLEERNTSRSLRLRPVLALAPALALLALQTGCTETNPGFEPEPDVAACSPGQRTCQGNQAMVCVPRPEPAHWEVERVCPQPSLCQQGSCAPPETSCQGGGGCPDGMVCTLFAIPGTGQLSTYCAAPVGSIASGLRCASNQACRSGLCVKKAGGPAVCFQPCGKNRQCPAVEGTPLRCVDLTVTVNGIQGLVAGCVP